MKIAVTGGSGKLGRSVVQRLNDEGHEVLNLDRAGEKRPGLVLVDLNDYGQVVDALLGIDDRHTGFDAVVHLGAIPAPASSRTSRRSTTTCSPRTTFSRPPGAPASRSWCMPPARRSSACLSILTRPIFLWMRNTRPDPKVRTRW